MNKEILIAEFTKHLDFLTPQQQELLLERLGGLCDSLYSLYSNSSISQEKSQYKPEIKKPE